MPSQSRRSVLSLLLLVVLGSAGAQDLKVDEAELKSAGREIVFINFEGPQGRIDSADEIRSIGFLLAGGLEPEGRQASFLNKYTIIRAVDPTEKERFDADIFSIDADARVDHIDNLRRILAGYLEAAHGYSREDARLLATFATYYNAVYRGNLDYFASRYKAVVLSHLSPADAGISTKYFEWPGATRMLIPLSAGAKKGDLSALSTTEITGGPVVEEMRKREDKGLPERKEMVELKEREVEKKREELAQARSALESEKEEAAREEARLKAEQAKPTSAAAAAGQERAEKALAAKKEEIARQEEAAAKKEESLRAKEAEVEKDRKAVVKDEQERIREEAARKESVAAAAAADRLYYLRVHPGRTGEGRTGRLTLIDPASSRLSLSSPVEHASGRYFAFFRERILVIAHEGGPASPARLALLDPQRLEPALRSEEGVHPDSAVALEGGRIYAVSLAEGAPRLACFDERLQLVSRSAEEVDPGSALTLFGGRVYVNAPDGRILVLDQNTLKLIAAIP